MLLLGAALVGVLYFLHTAGVFGLFTNRAQLLSFIYGHGTYAALVFIGLQALQVVAAPVPGEITGFVGGYIFGPVRGVAYSTIGLTLGSWLAFVLARLLGRPLVDKFVARDLITRYDYVMEHKGLFVAFLMFLIPGFPKDYLCYVLGLGHMRQADFLLVSAAGRLVGTVLLTLGGAYIRDERFGAFLVLVSISLVTILAALLWRDRLEAWFRDVVAKQRRKPKG
jgi:uncharacterized membrane protein YdjX (TVP38/TMEM64 family)